MIRTSIAFGVNTLTVRNLNAYDHLILSGPHIQCVRWKRKPIWLPTAKSKMFRIPVRPVIPTEDYVELKRLHNNYRTLMKSLTNFFIEQETARTENLDESVVKKNVEQDFEICSYLNEKWNRHVAAMRDERIKKEREQRKEEIIMKLEAKKQRDLRLQTYVDSKIRKAKEEAPTFITPENIDQAILSVLENITDHNAAIDLNGNYYKDEPQDVQSQKVAN